MGSGYFGKLPAKADFLTGNCPAGFLRLWEPFLEKGMAQSRLDLGSAWEDAYMTMPIWHFWLKPTGSDSVLSEPVAGAFMPSVDKVGREFPMTVMSTMPASASGPQSAGQEIERLETLLLQALETGADLSAFRRSITEFEFERSTEDAQSKGSEHSLTAEQINTGVDRSTFWCRAGEGEFAFSCNGLPAAGEFRWLILPEKHQDTGEENKAVGISQGQIYPEDHRR